MVYLTCLLTLCSLGQAAEPHPENSLLRAIADAFLSNQTSFPYGQVAFTFKRGSAKDDLTARRGDLSPAYTAKCLYYFNGASARYERIFPDEAMRAANKKIGSDIMSIIDTYRMATNGALTLYDSITVADGINARGTKLSPGARDFERDFRFPLSLGRADGRSLDNLGKHLLDALQGGPGSRSIQGVDEREKYEGREVVKLTLTSATELIEYQIDLERGAIPLRLVRRETAPASRAGYYAVYHLEDLRLIPGRGWLPFKESWWHSDDHRAYQIVIEDADFAKPPGEEAFALDFPKAVSLVNESKGVRYPPQSKWNVLKLPRSDARGVQKVEYAAVPGDQVPKLPGEIPASPGYDFLIYGAVATILALGLVLWRRHRVHA